MRGIAQSWRTASDAAQREALARRAIEQVTDLLDGPGWELLRVAIEAQIDDTMHDLARSQKDDEQNRGIIRALNHVLSMPDNLIRAASAELNRQANP